MTDERAPEAPRDARLTAAELEAVRALVCGEPLTDEQGRVLDVLLGDDVEYDWLLLVHLDALAAENARLTAAAQMALDLEEWRYSAPIDEVMREVMDRAQLTVDTLREALTRRADGGA